MSGKMGARGSKGRSHEADGERVERVTVVTTAEEERRREGVVRLVLISDTHNKHRQLVMPAGDLLIHAGDFTERGRARFGNKIGYENMNQM
jgi:hypothetical protein